MQNRIPIFLLLTAMALLVQGCAPPLVGDVVSALKGPDYVQSIEARSHVVEVRHLPRALRILESLQPEAPLRLSTKALDSLRKINGSAEDGIVFLLRLSPRDAAVRRDLSNDVIYGRLSGYANYQETQREYALGFAEKIWIEADGIKIPLASYQMENTFGMTSGRYFVLTFPDFEDHRPKHVKLVLDDIVPGLARQKFNWTLPVGKYDNLL